MINIHLWFHRIYVFVALNTKLSETISVNIVREMNAPLLWSSACYNLQTDELDHLGSPTQMKRYDTMNSTYCADLQIHF